MVNVGTSNQSPPVDEVLRTAKAADAARADGVAPDGSDGVATATLQRLEIAERPNLQPAFHLTGTVLHANLGRAPLADAATRRGQPVSGALPLELLPRAGLAIAPRAARHGSRLAAALSAAPLPVAGRIENMALRLDLRRFDDEQAFAANLAATELTGNADALV